MMNNIFVFILLVFPAVSIADMYDETKLEILNAQIESLTRERDEKYKKLKECERTTDGFKIAGITTLVATGFGIYGNVYLHEKLNGSSGGSSGGGSSAAMTESRSDEQKASDECAMFCEEFPADAADVGCDC